VIEGEPLQSVDKRLIIVDTEAQDFGSGAGTVVVVLDGGGVFGLLQVAAAEVPGPAAFDSLENHLSKRKGKNETIHRCVESIMYDIYLYKSSDTNPFDANGAGSVPLLENLSANDAKQRSAPSAT
jgi:hypothetical protein